MKSLTPKSPFDLTYASHRRMWLLSTDRAELYFFSNAGAVAGGYAILPHTWDPDGEQTFQEVQRIGEQCKTDGSDPRDYVSAKVRECCTLAEKHGYRWAWVDSCCIDKTGSTELSEAINSMFQWYAQAEVCYAYLADVPSGCNTAAEDSSFRKSRWHTRGWTLQELIAPAIVVFLSKDWEELGMKSTLAILLEEITRVHHKVLTRDVPHFAFSVAIRMCWAAPRRTTRIEDEAYCLMGLFGVSLSTIYGEGRRVFMRLQEEILKDELDASLFVWSKARLLAPGELSSQDVRLLSPAELPEHDPHGFLLAPSPACFNIPTVYIPNLGPNTEQLCPPLRVRIVIASDASPSLTQPPWRPRSLIALRITMARLDTPKCLESQPLATASNAVFPSSKRARLQSLSSFARSLLVISA